SLPDYIAAQTTPTWQWAKHGGNKTTTSSSTLPLDNIVTDVDGNVYRVGGVGQNDSFIIDGQRMDAGTITHFISSWDCNGNHRWNQFIKSNNSNNGYNVIVHQLASDTLNGIYISGSITYNDTVSFDNNNILYNAKGDFLVKYDLSGNIQWLKYYDAPATSPNEIVKMEVSPDGKIFLFMELDAGSYDNNAFTITTAGYYIVEYNQAGNYTGHIALPIQNAASSNSSFQHFKRNHKNGN